MKKKLIAVISLVLALAMLLPGCAQPAQTAAEPAAEPAADAAAEPAAAEHAVADKLVVLISADASTFDPHQCTDSATELLNKNIYNNLVCFDTDMNVQPELATEWSLSEDELTWTFTLREGVKFHDGSDFNAEAVKKTFERILAEETASPRRSVLSSIQSVETDGDYTVKITTEYPNGAFLQQLCHPCAAIISPTAVETYGEEYSKHPAGTGAFKFVSWSVGEKVVLERNEEYFEGAPLVKQIEFLVVPDGTTRTLLIQSGVADVAISLPLTDVSRLQAMDTVNVLTTDSTMTMYVAINNQKGVLQDARVRQALNYAVDKQAIIDNVLNGIGTVADCPVSPATWGYNSISAYEYNPEKAKELLTEAGYPDGIHITLWTPVGRYLMDTQICQVLKEMWQQAGITVDIQEWEFQALMSEVKKGEFDMVYLGWSPSTGDADQGLYPVFHSTQWPPASNRAHYANETVDDLIMQARMTTDSAKRLELYKQAETTIMDEAAWVFLFYNEYIVATTTRVNGVIQLPTEHLLFKNVTVD